MASPLHITSALAFTYAPADLLALAGDALSPLCASDGRMLWQFTQGATPEPPPRMGSFFRATTTYGTGAYDGGGTMQHWRATIHLVVRAIAFQQDGSVFSGYTLEFSVGQGDNMFEMFAMVTCRALALRLVERRWIGGEQATGFWKLVNRGWSHPDIVSAAHPTGEFHLTCDLEKHGMFPYFDRQNVTTVHQAMNETRWTRALFDR